MTSIQSQIDSFVVVHYKMKNSKVRLQIVVKGEPDSTCFTRAEFSECGKDPVSLDVFLGWFAWRNGFTVRHDPPNLEFIFEEKCVWKEKPQGF